MRQPPDLPRIFSGRGQLFQEDRPPVDVRYQIVLAATPAVPAVATGALTPVMQAAPVPGTAAATQAPAKPDHASGQLVVLNRADLWRIDTNTEYQLTLTNGGRCRVTLHHDPYQPFTKYRISVPTHDLR